MGIWIRTQDRERLIEIKAIRIWNKYITGIDDNNYSRPLRRI